MSLDRRVSLYTTDDFIVSTVKCFDAPGYETGVRSKHYNSEKWIIVEEYASREAAEAGHEKWVKTMTGSLPDQLTDVSTNPTSMVVHTLGGLLLGGMPRTFKRTD